MTGAEYGALPIQILRELIESGAIIGVDESCLQPSSIDLIANGQIYRMRGSLLPRQGETVRDMMKAGVIEQVRSPLSLRRNDVYLCELCTSLDLPASIYGRVSSKSSTGRIDVRCRLLADGVSRYDYIPKGYKGGLWVEIVPKSFDVRIHSEQRLNQLRLFSGNARLSTLEHEMLFDKFGLLRSRDGTKLNSRDHITENGVLMTVDLASSDIVAYRAKRPWETLDLASGNKYPGEKFFEAIKRPENGELVLNPGEFYLLGTKERIIIPPSYAAEMVQYDATIGNLFTHFAGFFDPGFGWRPEGDMSTPGNIAVLEVEVHSSATVLRHGQPICIMAYEKMLREPEQIYGSSIKSNYGIQDGVKLAKFFRES